MFFWYHLFLPGKGHASDRQTLVLSGMWTIGEGDSSSRVSSSGYLTEALGYWRHHMVLCRTTVAEGLKNAEGQKKPLHLVSVLLSQLGYRSNCLPGTEQYPTEPRTQGSAYGSKLSLSWNYLEL